MENLIGLIPAAGKGLRLGLPYPKELYPIIRDNRYKPVSQFILENMTVAGIEHIVFVINETKHQLMGYFGDGSRFGCHLSYVVQENRENEVVSTSPGLAQALNSAYHLTRGKTVCFGMPDTILYPQDVFNQALIQVQSGDSVILGLFPADRPEKVGMVDLDIKDGRVLRIIDKPPQTNLLYGWAFIIWQPQFTEFLNDCFVNRGMDDLAVIMNEAIHAGMNFRGFPIPNGSYVDLGTYDDIMSLEKQSRAP